MSGCKFRMKNGILILGASGGVAQALLHILSDYRFMFEDVVLVDRNDLVTKSKTIQHNKLDYVFYKKDILDKTVDFLEHIKEKHKVTMVLDLTDCETLPILSAADSLGLSYLNCSLNTSDGSMVNYVEDVKKYTSEYKNNSHIVALGMNPGIINHLIIKGVLEHGVPHNYVEIEFETGKPRKTPVKPFITWSKKQFLNESVWDRAGYCADGGRYVESRVAAVDLLEDTSEYLLPIKKLKKYPRGMVVSHDEIITMSRTLEIPGKFVYAIHPSSLRMLLRIIKSGRVPKEEDMIFLDNVDERLSGSDLVGVWLNYDNKKVCYFTEIRHKDILGTNATLYLVAVGFLAGLIDFIINPLLEPGVLNAADLDNKTFLQIVDKYVSFKSIILNTNDIL